MKKLDLGEIKNRINHIDRKLVELIEERMEIVKEVALYKKENSMKIFDRKREEEVIDKNLSNVNSEELKHYIENILKDIMDSSKEYQKFKIGSSKEYVNDLNFNGKKLGYTGVPGAYAYEVMVNLLKNSRNSEGHMGTVAEEILNFNTHRELVEGVESGKVDFAILPIENSIVGEVRDSIDLINKRNIYIVGEVRHKIEHNLLGIKGSKIEDIKRVYSHEQALMQCSEFLGEYSEWEKIRMSNTALSAKYIGDIGNKENACIANMETRKMYNLELLKPDINNEKENFTRFFIVSNKNLICENSEKISVITSTKNEAGALIKLLKVFSDYGLNMVNLKSRPKTNKPWEYYFYIDFEGNLEEEKVKKALEEIREKSIYLQILGNYKIYNVEI